MTNLKKNIVALADDDPDDREIFADVCSDVDLNLEVVLFKNGKELLDHLDTPKAKIPGILFLDINMPVVDGFECLRAIRSKTEFNELCVIVYSTSVNSADVSKAKNLGADGFLQKPSSYGKLRTAFQKILDTDWSDPCSQLNEMNFLINA